MFKRLGKIGVPCVAMLLMASLAAPALASSASFEMTVNKKAVLSPFSTMVTVSGSYRCTEPASGIDPFNSGMGGQVTQVVSRGRVVSGGGGFDSSSLNCNGSWQQFTFEIQANSNGQPEVWKNGRAAGSFNGGVCGFADQDGNMDCAQTGVDLVLQLR